MLKKIMFAVALAASSCAYANQMFISPLGLNFGAPQVSGKSNVSNPKIGDIVFDSTDSSFWGNTDGTGTGWTELGGSAITPSQSYELSNLSFATSVSGNALTISLKDKDGNDPSAGSPVKIGFRNSTSTTGTYSQQTVSSALSLTVSSGSTLGSLNGVTAYLYVYAIYTGSSVALGVINGSILDEGSVYSSTAEGGAGAADSANILYSAAAQTSKPVRLIGRIAVNEATAGTWASNSTEVSLVPFYKSDTQFVLTATGTNWTTTRAVGVPYRTADGAWRIRLNVAGTLSVAAATPAITITNVTFKTGQQQACTAADNNGVRTFSYSRANPGASTVTTNFSGTVTDLSFSCDVELDSKPSFVP